VLSFSLSVTDACGLESSPDETIVTVGDVPIAGLVAANSSPAVLGQPTLLSATVASGGNVTYKWALGDGHHRLGPVVSHTYSAAGT
jgi:hypothetical protein